MVCVTVDVLGGVFVPVVVLGGGGVFVRVGVCVGVRVRVLVVGVILVALVGFVGCWLVVLTC